MVHKEEININKVLVFAVHPDDETLGCGGSLLKHKDNGDEIHWLIATDIKGVKGFDENDIKKRDIEINNIESFYGFDSVHRIGLMTTNVDKYSMNDLIKKISYVVNKVKPNIVYLPFKGDIHSDHVHIFNAAYSCTKSFRYPFIKKIYMMEVLSETEFSISTQSDSFVPNVFVDISDYMNKKIEAMNIYNTEIASPPFPRSDENIKALAIFRGSTSGCRYSESFMLVKEIK